MLQQMVEVTPIHFHTATVIHKKNNRCVTTLIVIASFITSTLLVGQQPQEGNSVCENSWHKNSSYVQTWRTLEKQAGQLQQYKIYNSRAYITFDIDNVELYSDSMQMLRLRHIMRLQSKITTEAEVSARIIWLYVRYCHCIISSCCIWYRVPLLHSLKMDLAIFKNVQELRSGVLNLNPCYNITRIHCTCQLDSLTFDCSDNTVIIRNNCNTVTTIMVYMSMI